MRILGRADIIRGLVPKMVSSTERYMYYIKKILGGFTGVNLYYVP